MFLGRHVTQHGATEPANHGRTDARRNVIITRRDVRRQRAQRVERRFAAFVELLVHVDLDLVHGHMPRPLDHDLAVLIPGDFRQLTEGFQFRELGPVIRISNRARPQAIAQAKAHIVSPADVADFVEVGVEEAFPVMGQAPLRHDGAAAADNAGDPVGCQMDVGQPHARMDREVIHPLLRLFDQRVAEDIPIEVFRHTAHFFQRLIDWHRADGHGTVAHDPFADVVDVAPRRQIHDRVGAPADGPDHLVHFFRNARRHSRIADISVDLHQEVPADDHRFGFRVIDVGRDDRPAARHFIAHEFRRHIIPGPPHRSFHRLSPDPSPSRAQCSRGWRCIPFPA